MFRTTTFLLSILCTSCSAFEGITVHEDIKPWQKNILAQDDMQFPPDEMHAYSDEHIYFSKEASTGGKGVGGGGCGCN